MVMSKIAIQNIVYVTRDLERALGLPLDTKGYYIISNYSAFAKTLVKGRKNVLLVKNPKVLDTRELLSLPVVKRFVNKIKNPSILVFKNTTQIEEICKSNGWKLLNPSAALSSEVEEKIAGAEWLGPLQKYLPPHEIIECGKIKWAGEKFVLQFNRAHTGSGTILIESGSQLNELKKKFPVRPVRVTKFIAGPALTNNNVVWGDKVLMGNINYQITGLKPFTNLPFATIGNDWALPHKLLSKKQRNEYSKIATDIGKRLIKFGWRGLYGIDVIMDSKTGKLYLIEINARQPASTSYESKLQLVKNKKGLTTFEAHLLALLGKKYKKQKLVEIKNGAQITQKVVPMEKLIDDKLLKYNVSQFQKEGWGIYLYDNTENEKDWLRVQSRVGLMSDHNVFNRQGILATFFGLAAIQRKYWNSNRVGAVIVKDDKVLMFRRHRFGNDYYAFPGGTVEPGEKLLTALHREIEEETGLKITVVKKKPMVVADIGRKEYYFLVEIKSGVACLGGEEKLRHSPDNSYVLEWVDIKQLSKIVFSLPGINKMVLKLLS